MNQVDLARSNDSGDRHLVRARAVARLLDSAIQIPGTKRKIGLDPILGLIPFVGDFAGAILSGYIVLAAAFAGVPVFTLIRMIVNIGVDTLVGSVPLAGDFFDAAWKSNDKNVLLFESYLGKTSGARRSSAGVSRMVAGMLLVSSLLFLALLTFVGALIAIFLRHQIIGR